MVGKNVCKTNLLFTRVMKDWKEGKCFYHNGKLMTTYTRKGKEQKLEKPKEMGYIRKGYRIIDSSIEGIRYQVPVHRLIYAYFNNMEELPEELVINHKNGNKSDNRIENLELVTHAENIRHADRLKLRGKPKGEENGNSSLKKEDVIKIKGLLKSGLTQKEIGDIFGVSQSAIYYINSGKTWGWLNE